jgi:hypothetical protein
MVTPLPVRVPEEEGADDTVTDAVEVTVSDVVEPSLEKDFECVTEKSCVSVEVTVA